MLTMTVTKTKQPAVAKVYFANDSVNTLSVVIHHAYIIQYIGIRTKWLPFCRRQFQMQNICTLFQISVQFVPGGPIDIRSANFR